MTSYFDKRKKQKLYQQWVDKSGLPPENIPAELSQKSDSEEIMDGDDGINRTGLPGLAFRLTIRHILYLLLAIGVLLITTSVLITILIMRSC